MAEFLHKTPFINAKKAIERILKILSVGAEK